MSKHVVFDVVGTCVGYGAFFAGIEKHIGPRLREHGIPSQLFGFAWMESSEREFTFLSISERYVPYKDVFKSLFYRVLWMSGISDPRSFATDAERDAICATYSDLELREGVKETFELLRKNGFTVWCLTTGDVERVRGYFLRARVDMPMENFKSCDAGGVAKPALAAYRPLFREFKEEDEKWFAAAHYWDVSAAKKIGFKGAYCSVYEKEDCAELFGEKMDVMSDTLPEMARKIIEACGK
ncbi:putative 2-haloalkanoic acid dehalogenase [Pseudomassariella vexata]|uniref:Putative 2-haloalkanoic acid dehalogenase n=1 Tax=Pseudomassariella vexata TaxID=1141098 RepID=A0A1Y2DH64_9PEZI|nr:putative 2-haloalkanoic acid dehalogenase [Pseudomassariella vexata]ORY58577.1 putative 2-haloalkanoic acid dehalogenase [Pseudomassariella vexata]